VLWAFQIIFKMPLIVFLCANDGLDQKCLPHMKHMGALNKFLENEEVQEFFWLESRGG
jgi:hypothetical protein